MPIKTLLTTALLAFIALPCAAEDIQTAYAARTKELGTLLAIDWMCAKAGYTVDPDIVPRTVEPVVAQAEKDGMTFEQIAPMVSSAIETATKDEMATMNAYLAKGDTKGWFAHVDGKCRAYTAQLAYAPYISLPAGADDKARYKGFDAWVSGMLKGA